MADLADVSLSGTAEFPVLQVMVSEDTTVSRVELVGELDVAAAEGAGDTLVRLARRGYQHVEVDLSRLDFIDVAGARALLAGHRAMRAAGGRLTVTGARPVARRMLHITGYDKILRLE